MHRTRIKICGVMRPSDARAAVDAGADAIGMILHADAPRLISLDLASQIIDAVPDHVDVVGVFVDADAHFIREVATDLQLDQVQLHGHESPQIMQSLQGLEVVKVLRDEQFEAWPTARGLMLEPGDGKLAGGNGIEADWDALAARLDNQTARKRESLVIAGGLRPDNVAGVVERFRPWTIDVSSGVEETLGMKSIEKMQAFCAAIRSVDQSL
jgi:phosphoribosylanthranilate isomerase